MDGKHKFFCLVAQHGGKEVRWKNHRVFRFPCGVQFVISKTPSDHRSWEIAHSKLRRLLGLTSQTARVGLRRTRKLKHRSSQPITAKPSEALSFEALMIAQGVKEAKWREHV